MNQLSMSAPRAIHALDYVELDGGEDYGVVFCIAHNLNQACVALEKLGPKKVTAVNLRRLRYYAGKPTKKMMQLFDGLQLLKEQIERS